MELDTKEEGNIFRCDCDCEFSASYRLESTSSGVEDTDNEDGDAGNIDVNSCHLRGQSSHKKLLFFSGMFSEFWIPPNSIWKPHIFYDW